MKPSDKKMRITINKETVWLIALFFAGFLMRLIYVAQNRLNPLYILSSSTFTEQIPDWYRPVALWRSPAFLYLEHAIFNIFAHSWPMLRIFVFVLGSINLILIYLLAKKIFNVAVARIASLIALLYMPFIIYEGNLYESPFCIFFGLIFFLTVLGAFTKPSKLLWFLSGISWAMATLLRHHFFLFGMVVIIYLLIDFFKDKNNKVIIAYIVCMVLGLFIIISPITLRNMIVGKDFVLIGYAEGVSFWHGNNPDFDKLSFMVGRFGWEQQMQMPYQELKPGRLLKASEIEHFFFRKAIQFIREHPFQWLALMGKKTAIFFSGYEAMDDSYMYVYRAYSPMVRMLLGERGMFYPFGIVCPLAIIGIILSARINRKSSLLTIMMLSAAFLDILIAVRSRYRMSAVPFFIIAAAYTLWWWYENMKGRRQRKILLASIVSFVILVFLCNIYIYRPKNNIVEARIHDRLAEGYLVRMKNIPMAIIEFRKAIELFPDNPSIALLHMDLANLYKRQNDLDKAIIEYENASRKDQCNAIPHIELGIIFERKNIPDRAIMEYSKAAALPMPAANQVFTHLRLGLLYKRKMFYNDAVKELQSVIGYKGFPRYKEQVLSAYMNLAQIYEIAGRRDDAIAMYKEASRLDPENFLIERKIETLGERKEPELFEKISPMDMSNDR